MALQELCKRGLIVPGNKLLEQLRIRLRALRPSGSPLVFLEGQELLMFSCHGASSLT
jgi:hypothetical protein